MVNTLEQNEPNWSEIAGQVALLVVQHGAELAVGSIPIVGPLATKVLDLAVSGQSEEVKQLQLIHINTQRLIEGPYYAGMEHLNQAAQPHRNKEDRQEYIKEARREFISALGQESHQFRRALTEFHLGTCSILLSSKEDARHWFERAYTSALRYLYEESAPAYAAFVRMQEGDQVSENARTVGGVVGGAGGVIGSFFVPIVGTGIGMVAGILVGGGIGEGVKAWRKYSYSQAEKKFREEAPPVFHLTNALQRLQREAKDLGLKYEDPLPSTPEEWIYGEQVQ